MKMNRAVALCWAVIAVLSFEFGCTKPPEPGSTASWVTQLDAPKTRVEALKELGKLADPKATDVVVKWFKTEGEWQPEAAYTLGLLGDRTVIGTLRSGIDYAAGAGKDAKTQIKIKTNINIARALALLEANEAVEDLIKLADSAAARTREGAVRSLGALRDPRAIPIIVEIGESDRENFMRRVAVESLGVLGHPDGVPFLVKMLYQEVPGVSFYNEARFSLIEVGAPAVPLLLQTLRRQNEAVENLKLPSGGSPAEGSIEAKAASVLGALRVKEAEPAMIDALNQLFKRYQNRHNDPVFGSVPGAVVEIAYALGDMRSTRARDALIPLLKETDDSRIRQAASEALVAIGDRSAVSALLDASKTGDLVSRGYAIVAASRLGGGEHLAAFDALGTQDETIAPLIKSERVRLEAAAACQDDPQCWKGKLNDQDVRVRERAVYQLGWLDQVDASKGDLMKLTEDSEAQVRTAAVRALGEADSLDADALEAVYNKWKDKIEYKLVNSELKLLIVKARSQQGHKDHDNAPAAPAVAPTDGEAG